MFIHAEPVDIDERFPFYKGILIGSTTTIVTAESRVKTQFCIVRDYIKSQSDLNLLRHLWSRISAFTNYQTAFCDFDWEEERPIVSFVPIKHPSVRWTGFEEFDVPFQAMFQIFHLRYGGHCGTSGSRSRFLHRIRGHRDHSIHVPSILE